MQFHAETWQEVFGNSNTPEKLFVSGNHDIIGGIYNNFAGGIFPNANEYNAHVFGVDTAKKWEKIWGEKYNPIWHKVVGGYHFIGQHWGADGSQYNESDMVAFLNKHSNDPWMHPNSKPFFIVRHVAPGSLLSKAINKHPNAITLFGHAHGSAANWNMARLHRGNAVIEVPSCEPRGTGGLAGTLPFSKVKIEGELAAGSPRCAYVIKVYDNFILVERGEFSNGKGSLGPDWIFPLKEGLQKSFSVETRKTAIGSPQFARGSKPAFTVKEDKLQITIPCANGNKNSRVYAYEATISAIGIATKLLKCVFAEGLNLAIGSEPNKGVTSLDIPLTELPARKNLTLAVQPVSSLGTKGKPITLRINKV